MAGLSQALTPKILDHTTSKAVFSLPTVYLALLVSPGASGTSTLSTMNEVSTGAYPNYARAAVSTSALASAIISGGGLGTNSLAITFPVCGGGGSSPVITGYALVDAASGTTANPTGVLWYGTFSSSMTVNSGNQPSIPASNLNFSLTTSGGSSNFLVEKLIDLTDGKATYTPGGALYAALVTGSPAASQINAATDIIEPSSGQYTGYTRVQIPSASWSSAVVSTGVAGTTLTATVTFPTCTGGGTATITGFALIDGGSTASGSGGNILYWGTLTSQTISINTTPYFNIGGLTINLQ